MNFITNVCACGSPADGIQLYKTQDYNFNVTNDTTWVLQCPACGSLFPALFPSSKTLGYAYSTYYTVPKKRQGLKKILRNLIDATRTEHIVRSTPRSAKTVFDFGCGSGEFLNLLVEHNFKAQLFGTDITQPKVDGPAIYKWLPVEDFVKNDQRYDWITLSHVIEHLPNATQVIRRLRSCCHPKSGLWLSTPNANSVLISTFREHARDIDFPRHRQIYSRKMLTQMLSSEGFNVDFLPSPRIDTVMNYASCIKNLAQDQSVSITRKITVVLISILRLVIHLLKPAALRTMDAPEIVVVARPSV